MTISAELEGAPALTRKLRELGRLEDGKVLKSAGRAAGKVVVKRAQALIPVNKVNKLHKTYKGRYVAPGFAKRSIKYITVLSKDKQKVTVSVGVRKEAFYAVSFVEMGTSRMPAQRWLRPAFQSTSSEQQKALTTHLKKAIEKIARKK